VYSPDLYPSADRVTDIDSDLSAGLQELAERNQLQVILIAEINCVVQGFEVVAGFNVPVPPFNGANKFAVDDVLKECFKLHPKPHVHAIGEYALAQFVRKLSRSEHGTNRVWFIPFTCLDRQVVFLGFPRNDCQTKAIPNGLDKEGAALLLSRVGRIWEFGYRGRGARERHVNGSGIGLFTVRKIVQAHLGKVITNSGPGDPSVTHFVVTLPKDTLGTKLML
jgi:hypothetical protein